MSTSQTLLRFHLPLFAVVILLVVLLMTASSTLGNVRTMGGADRPNDFRDQKDIARIETCVGSCLSRYSGPKEFISKNSMKMAGLQVLFIGEYPKLYIYGGDQETKQEIDIREKSAEEIEKILLSAGCQYRQ
ncbi:hypothetical protein FDP41_013248 [Naegleria fowleri]|uniref:Selenoprotein F/M domain-containing protein n=1 Tax=Naegleria fowleri TaxID=5763 RepID=A0A6A5C5L8_NAEFO|nr:uncharacterized protein FDP41_013248 [Naegleria fowleri]KAF0980765.1 hypothetical protein FDP41_013248 [Naegleria fowleri]CAG4719190.1 unnamed protein product [Naegleria fowleri]